MAVPGAEGVVRMMSPKKFLTGEPATTEKEQPEVSPAMRRLVTVNVLLMLLAWPQLMAWLPCEA